MTAPAPTIDLLLNLVPERPDSVLTQLHAHPSLAAAQDAHGYSLLHAAASYNHEALASALVRTFGVDPDLRDEDAESPLFAAEALPMARLLLELGADPAATNADGQTAADKLEADDEWPEVAAFLRGLAVSGSSGGGAGAGGDGDDTVRDEGVEGGSESRPPPPPPPLPDGVQINLGTMSDADAGGEPDPEFRRRIQELAEREDFGSEEGQSALRRLVEDAVSGISGVGEGQGSATRRRLG